MKHGILKVIMGGIAIGMLVMSQSPLVQAQEVAPFRATGMSGYAGFGYEREDESRENRRINTSIEDKDTTWFEEVGLGLNGYVYHPRLLEFKADTKLVHSRESDVASTGYQQKLKDRYANYNLFMDILKEHPVSFWLEANQNTQDVISSFIENSRITNDRRLAGLNYQNKILPLVMGYEQFTSRGEGLNQTDDEVNRFFTEIKNNGILGRSRLKYENEDRSQNLGLLDLKANVIDFSNDSPFGNDRHTLMSLYHFRNQKGSIPLRNAYINENLMLRHTDTFHTYYDFYYNDMKLRNQDSTLYQYRAGLTHQLYESLSSQFEVSSTQFFLDSGTDDKQSANAGLDYTKKVPFGRLRLDYHARLENEKANLSGNLIYLFQEKHTFGENLQGSDLIILDHDLIDRDSIELVDQYGFPLKDPAGFPLEEGIHYRIEAVGTLTRIKLLNPDGSFLVGQEVYVNYNYEPLPAIDFNTTDQRYGVSLDLDSGWRIFYDGARTKQALQDGVDLGRLDDITERGFGTEVVWKCSTTRAEKRVNHSRRAPYERETYSEDLLFPIGASVSMGLRGSYSDTLNLSDNNVKTIRRTVSARLMVLLPLRARWETETEYGNNDEIGENLKSFEFRTKLLWQYYQFDFTLSYDNLHWNREVTGKEDRQRIFLKVRRSFDLANRVRRP